MADEGDIAINRRSGERRVFQGGQWVPVGGKPEKQEASMRSRMDMGLAPMVQAHEGMRGVERKSNPYGEGNRDNLAARVMSDVGLDLPAWGVRFHPLEGVAKSVGGQDFQDYQQAAKTFESQLMPIMSGAAVSPSEAERQIKAALPEPGDSPETLQKKGRVRSMMLNGAAKARGLPLPYPDVPTWGVNTLNTGGSGAPGGRPATRRYNPKTGRIE